MRALEASGRLREANTRIIDSQQSMPIAMPWGQGSCRQPSPVLRFYWPPGCWPPPNEHSLDGLRQQRVSRCTSLLDVDGFTRHAGVQVVAPRLHPAKSMARHSDFGACAVKRTQDRVVAEGLLMISFARREPGGVAGQRVQAAQQGHCRGGQRPNVWGLHLHALCRNVCAVCRAMALPSTSSRSTHTQA